MIPHVTVADYALWEYCVEAECEVITIHDTLLNDEYNSIFKRYYSNRLSYIRVTFDRCSPSLNR